MKYLNYTKAGELLGINRNTISLLVKEGKLPTKTIVKRRLIPDWAIELFLKADVKYEEEKKINLSTGESNYALQLIINKHQNN